MGVGSGRSKVTDLAFRVFNRAIHPEWFSVKSHSRVSRTGWDADIRIVEGGHAIIWGTGSARLAEVLVSAETLLPELGGVFQSTVRRERSTRLSPDRRSEYQTCFAAERLDPEVFAHITEELTLDSASGDLFHRFAPTNRMMAAPVSRLHVEARGCGLSVQAFHTFPAERAIVRVQSLFEVVA